MAYRNDGATPRQRFDEKVGPPDGNGCRLWLGGTTSMGYGLFYADGQMRPAHRWALEQYLGRKLGRYVDACHRCDVRRCVEVSHLFHGSRADNMQDAALKGRTDKSHKPKGEAHGMARLTLEEVTEIRALYEFGFSQSAIATQFPVSVQQVHRIIHRQLWKGNGHASQ